MTRPASARRLNNWTKTLGLLCILLAGSIFLRARASSGLESGTTAVYLPLIEQARLLPPAVTAHSQLPAFDICKPPALSTMQTWWDESPYYSVGVYLGGVSFSCRDTPFTAAWVTGAAAQGWRFIPVWVGPQSYCFFNDKSKVEKIIDNEIGIAYQQGINEANLARQAASDLGLTDDAGRTLIYYDLEAYNYLDEPVQACRAAALAFLQGWTQRLHELGSQSGVYGTGCSSFAGDWASLSAPPDHVWLASWYTIDGAYRFDPDASVFEVRCLSDELWADQQRLRQYTGGHDESWGSKTLRIDSNAADGNIVYIPTATPGPITNIQTTLATAIAPHALIHEERLWLTSDATHWQEITPPLQDDERPLAVTTNGSDLDELEIWLVAGPGDGTRLTVYHSPDRGWNWQRQPIPIGLIQPEEGAQVTAIQFSDTRHGWISLQIPSSSNFSHGYILRSVDGGDSWERLPLPVAGMPHFNDLQTGWLRGGPSGEEAFITQDGGLSWQSIDAASAAAMDDIRQEQDTWQVRMIGQCQDKQNCVMQTSWWHTLDAGQTWRQAAVPGE